LNLHSEQSSNASDARPLSAVELLSALNQKFLANFESSRSYLVLAEEVERQARALSLASEYLEGVAGAVPHQRALAKGLDEIFGDSMCAVYLASCGMNVPARMLLRRSLELGLVVAAYWDSPVSFWTWREHDGDIRFATLLSHVGSDGYKTLCQRQETVSQVDPTGAFQGLDTLYGELSDVVHPKPDNFSTAGVNAYSFQPDDLRKTLSYAGQVHSAIATILSARFAGLVKILMSS